MFAAPVEAWEISLPPTTPRGTSRSGPGLMTFIEQVLTARPSWAASLPPLALRLAGRRHFDLQRSRFVIDLERGVVDVEAVLEQPLQGPAQLVAVVARAHHDVRRQRGKARGDLPDVQVVDLDHARLPDQGAADLV